MVRSMSLPRGLTSLARAVPTAKLEGAGKRRAISEADLLKVAVDGAWGGHRSRFGEEGEGTVLDLFYEDQIGSPPVSAGSSSTRRFPPLMWKAEAYLGPRLGRIRLMMSEACSVLLEFICGLSGGRAKNPNSTIAPAAAAPASPRHWARLRGHAGAGSSAVKSLGFTLPNALWLALFQQAHKLFFENRRSFISGCFSVHHSKIERSNFRHGSRATWSSWQRVRPCPLRTQSDRRP